jgi:acyl transferase domain-containing protein
MKTVLLFPGLDALFETSKYKRWLDVPVTKNVLAEASTHLSRLTGQPEDLASFIRDHSRPHVADFDRTLVALTALQVGIARGLAQNLRWDVLLGCSHGDIARSVIGEVFSFEHAVEILWVFAELRKTCPEGYAASVRAIEGELLPEHIDWLESQGAPVSLWSESNATVAGSTPLMQNLVGESRARGLKIKPVLRYPVHSPAMQPVAEKLLAHLEKWPMRESRWPIFSSVHVEYLTAPIEIASEALTGAVSAVKWTQSLRHLHGNENFTTFINVGPCNSLTGWMLQSEAMRNATLVDSWSVLGSAPLTD